ncbi:MAG: DUF2309 domain-containing protein [Parachlamydiaceae bacterium]
MMETTDLNIKNLIANAAEIIAPLWPMQTIIARNPLQSLESSNFEEAIKMAEKFFIEYDHETASVSSEVNRHMIKWCQAFLDEGQAAIVMPQREKGFYRAWSLLAPFDQNLRAYDKNTWLLSLPSDPEEAIAFCLNRLEIGDDQAEEYLKYSLTELPGWAGYIKWRADWQNREAGVKNPITVTDFLAVRLAITCAIQESSEKKAFKTKKCDSKCLDQEFFRDLKNKEEKYLLNLLRLILPNAARMNQSKKPFFKSEAQIVFCIDVRSEPLRMRIEREGNYETFGFAGFFGLPVSVHSYHTGQVKDCCPVLLKPRHTIFEEPIEEPRRIALHQKGRNFLKICQKFYQDLKYNFATPFALVETLGLWCGFWMAIRTLMPTTSVKLKRAIQEKIKPLIATRPKIDIPLAEQIIYAESALRMIGLTQHFSRLVVLCGHRSQTENNPYASALDCGACGGNHGGPNGKILAAILNSYEVRAALRKKEIAIPDETLFLGAEHNTTTDEVVIEDLGTLKETHIKAVEKLKQDLGKAGIKNSQYRCKTFGLNASRMNARTHVLKRSSNWSEVRPEWGLARNAAFIIGSRNLTKSLDLEGRCFLHSYEWEEDGEGNLLETLLTAPMVVAQWINTQYFFSTLNNQAYGSGSKITHNVAGKLGVMQGNSSDLMQGLPLQSVNSSDDDAYHEAMRLQVIVHAPRSRIDSIIEKHTVLQNLFFNHWVILVAVDPLDNTPYRLIEKGKWSEIEL